MRNRLVLSDRASEDYAFLGVADRSCDCRASDSDCLGRDQDSFRIQPIEQAMKSTPLAANQIGARHFQIVDEEQIGIDRGAAKFLELANLACPPIKVGKEQAH